VFAKGTVLFYVAMLCALVASLGGAFSDGP
jgi:hypothetical protein